MSERGLAQHAPQRCVEQDRELRIRALVLDGLIKAQRFLDAITREGVDHEALLIGGDHLLRRVFQIEDTFVDPDHAVDQRHLEVKAWLGHHADRLTEPDHQRLLGLIDGEHRRVAEHHRGGNEDEDDASSDTDPHRVPPLGAAGVCCGGRRASSLSGR